MVSGLGSYDANPGSSMNMQHKKPHVSVQKLLNAVLEYKRTTASCSVNLNEDYGLCSDPTQYDWSYISKKKMLVPYNCAAAHFDILRDVGQAAFLKSQSIRWESHHVWIVEGNLCRGESNVLQRRRFYIDEDSWMILLGEGYDIAGTMIKCYLHDSHLLSPTRLLGRWYNL